MSDVETAPFLTVKITVTRETHQAPQSIQALLTRAGGLNRYGEPNFRIVWGGSRLEWISGKWEDRDAEGSLVREVVEARRYYKYPQLNRWHVERWMPPETYGSPQSWKNRTSETESGRTVEALGPYPSRGEYEHVMCLENPDGSFMPLEFTVVEYLANVIRYGEAFTSGDRKSALARREEKVDESYDKFADDVLSDSPAFHGVPAVTVPAQI